MAKRFPLYPIIPPLCWPCRIKFVCPISHYIPMISPWNHCIHRLNYCKSIPMVVPRHIYIFKRLSLCMCVNMRDFMWSILGFLTLYPLNSINSHYTIYIYMYRIIYICISLYIIVYPWFTIVDHQVFSISLAPWTRFWTVDGQVGLAALPISPCGASTLSARRPRKPRRPEIPRWNCDFLRQKFPLSSGKLSHNYGKSSRSTMFHGKINYFYGDFP